MKTLTTADGAEVGVGATVWLSREGLPTGTVFGGGGLRLAPYVGSGGVMLPLREPFYSTREAAALARLAELRRRRAEIDAEIQRLEAGQ